ncbi:ion transporter [Magnetococcus sp. PR-3]|uniref:ion transporter n=1 Tax=Magnetococcus sp. PR-3 TaxID=3120355 RepID=UPI002FCE27E1
MSSKLTALVESTRFQNFITAIIVLNGIILGLLTNPNFDPTLLALLEGLDTLCLGIFMVEISLKMRAYGIRGFFRSGWNLFDFIIVAIALMPAQGSLSVLRTFRIFRVIRLVSVVPTMRRVVLGMLLALPGVGSVASLLVVVFYIAAVMATNLFGTAFPEWFGNLGASMYTLFQIMTLESWSMGIVRPVMAVYPDAWVFFIPFIMLTTFTVLNLFIGIIVDAMAITKEQEQEANTGVHQEPFTDTLATLGTRLTRIEEQLARQNQLLEENKTQKHP